MKKLKEIWQQLANEGYETDKGSVHDYISVYEEVLAQHRHTANNVLEIGLFNGYSLLLWEQYFTMADVYGIDCDEQPHGGMADLRPMIATGQHRIVIGDATSEEEIERHFGNIKWDVVIDDGSHDFSAQVKTIIIFSKRMAKDGILIIEDIQSIDKDIQCFIGNTSIDKSVEIVDRRHTNGRYDNVLIIIAEKK